MKVGTGYVILIISPQEDYWYGTWTLPYDAIGCYSVTESTLE
jgi:hypothetical protein